MAHVWKLDQVHGDSIRVGRTLFWPDGFTMEADYRASPMAPADNYDKARKQVLYFTTSLRWVTQNFDDLKDGLQAKEGRFRGEAIIPDEPKAKSLKRLHALKRKANELRSKLEEAKRDEYEAAPVGVRARMEPPEADDQFLEKVNSIYI